MLVGPKGSAKTCCRLQDLQSLIGSLHFACKVVAPGRPFLRRMIALTCGSPKPTSFIRLGKEFRKDLDMWALFLTSWNGVKFFLPPFSPCNDSIPLFTDASGSIGYGAYLHPHWFHGKWLPQHTPAFCTDISIAWQELFPIYLACALWVPGGDKRAQPGQLVIREPGFHSRGVQENTHKF